MQPGAANPEYGQQGWLDRSSLFNPTIFGMILTAAGCFFLLLAGQVTTLTCTRLEANQIDCTVQASWLGLGLLPSPAVAVHNLTSARVAEKCQGRCAYRVEVEGKESWVPLTAFHGTGAASKQAVADRVNAFIGDSGTLSLRVRDGIGAALLVPILIMVAGLGLMGYSLFRARRRAEKLNLMA